MKMSNCSRKPNKLSRRDFLHDVGIAAAGLVLASCTPKGTPAPTAQPVATQVAATVTQAGVAQATSVPVANPKATVAIAKAATYDPKLIKQQVQAVLDGIGGIADVLAHGNRVAIKVNMTGGVTSVPLPGIPEIESFITHPEVVRALIELLRDAGAKDIFIVEAAYEDESWPHYGFTDVAKSTGATIVDLTHEAPYKDFATTPVSGPGSPFIYDKFIFNPILQDVDAFISVPKMKCHNVCGVTQSMKNLIGLVPYRFYVVNGSDTYRSGFHGSSDEIMHRLPRVIMDLNRARRVNLSLIDAVMTGEGGEGPWITGQFQQVKAGFLLAGKDPVATDAVATATMGFDPTIEYPTSPFLHADNHLNIAHSLGLGTNVLSEIKVVGATIDEVKTPFKPSY